MARYSTDGSSALDPDDSNDSGNFRVINGGGSDQDRFSQSLDDFNPYYAPYYDNQNKDNPKNKKTKSNQKNANGKSLLRRAENSSLSPVNQEKTGTPWQNNVQGKAPVIPGPKGIKITKSKKGIVATIIILLILAGGGIFLGGTNALLPGALSNLFTNSTNSGYAGYTLRTFKTMSYMLRHNDADITTTDWKGLKRYTKISSTLKSNLAKNNIEIEGKGANTVLKWKQIGSDGTIIDTKTIRATEFNNELLNNAEFRSDFNSARRGKIATFFDNIANRVYAKLGISRNVFKDYRQTGDADTDTQAYRQRMSEQFDNNRTDFTNRGKVNKDEPVIGEDGKPVIGEDGKPVTRPTQEMENRYAGGSQTDTTVDANTQTRSYVAGLANTLAVGGNSICALMKFGNAISLILSNLEKYAGIRYFMTPMENVSKAMGGQGKNSAINEVLNNFTTPVSTEIELYNEGISTSGIDLSDIEKSSISATSSVRTKSVTGAPIQAEGAQIILGGKKGVSKDITNYSTERVSSSITKALGMSSDAIRNCIAVQTGAAVASIAVTILTAGTKVIADFAWDMLSSAAIGIAASAIVSFAIPTLANYLYRNVFESVRGIAAGELFASGAASANFKNGQSGSGQIPASKESVLQYNQSVKQVAALDAEVDRLKLSPLDTSSPNTFLGSIAYSTILPIITSQNNIISTIGSIFKTTAKSISNITGAAHADGEGETYMTTFGNDIGACPQLDAKGYACDIYGNHIPISALVDIEPDDPGYLDFVKRNTTCNDDGICTIVENSILANFVLANVNRDSPVYVADTNILGAFEIGNPITGAIPIIGDLVDIYDAAKDAENLGWADGDFIGDTPTNKYRTEILYSQVFVESQRALDILSSDSPIEAAYENPVTAFLTKYEAEHPIDNTPAGYISRITGLPKSTTETVLATVEYYEFLQNYDSSTRIAMTEENTTIQSASSIIAKFDNSKIDFSNTPKSEIQTEAFIAKQSEQYIIYADIRNRSFAA